MGGTGSSAAAATVRQNAWKAEAVTSYLDLCDAKGKSEALTTSGTGSALASFLRTAISTSVGKYTWAYPHPSAKSHHHPPRDTLKELISAVTTRGGE